MIILGFESARVAELYPRAVAAAAALANGTGAEAAPAFVGLPLPEAVVVPPGRRAGRPRGAPRPGVAEAGRPSHGRRLSAGHAEAAPRPGPQRAGARGRAGRRAAGLRADEGSTPV